jgi:hypothetical protein
MWRDRDHGLPKFNGHASRAIEAGEAGLKCRRHSELTRVYPAWSLHEPTLLALAADLQLRNQTIDSVSEPRVLL